MSPDLAITRFAVQELAAAGRRVAYRLQRIAASGIYGDNCGHRTLWDEYCFERQFGPIELLEWPLEATLSPLILDIIEKLPKHVAKLLSWHLASLHLDEADDVVNPDLLHDAIGDTAATLACNRKLSESMSRGSFAS